MNAKSAKRRVTAMVGTVAISMLALGGTTSAAIAAPQPGDYGNIDFDRVGSLTVHKFLNQAGSPTGDISVAPLPGDFADPVAGVEFTIYPLLQGGNPVDLAVAGNWDDLSTLTPGAACTAPVGYDLGAAVAMPPTDAVGLSRFDLAVGLYQVCETAAPAHIIDRAAPFILAVPMPFENGWVYDVHAYPKNAEGSIQKTIEPQTDFGLGSVVSFPVTVPVPRASEAWTGFGIRDTLDARLAPVAASEVTVTVDGSALDASHYTVVNDAQTVSFALTAAGLAWLNEGPNTHSGKNITVTFAGTVLDVGDGIIPNTAGFWPNNPSFDPAGNPPLPSNEVRTNWGDLEITKRSFGTSGSEGILEGAVFEIYAATDPYALDCSAAEASGVPITVGGETTFTSDALGTVTISGLFVSDNVNPAIDSETRCYVVKETAAPAGYVLPIDPFTAVTIQIGDTAVDNIEIENTQQSIIGLPITGAAGQILLISGGIAALAIAMGLVLKRRRQAHAAS